MRPVIEIDNISKRFRISSQRAAYLSIRERLGGLFKPSEKQEDFWALQNVSFSINEGDSVGIIGRNGAGKSTLLKILSRITPPTSGRITFRGRMASLLEVGTGFHQELTGRENIFMNGSILGMKRAEIKANFDAIIDFSGTEKFLDTPLKHYSSGMQLRLAFAVAAHLNPEILVIDEVLAVGDSEFQKKCLGKMEDATRQGKTILFVSHNMNAIAQLCNRAVLFKNGRLVKDEKDVGRLISYYMMDGSPSDQQGLIWRGDDVKNKHHTIDTVSITDKSGVAYEKVIHHSSPVVINISGLVNKADTNLNIGYIVYNSIGEKLFWSYANDDRQAHHKIVLREGRFNLCTEIPPYFLNEGSYHIEIVSVIHNRTWLIEPGTGVSLRFEIAGGHRNVALTPEFTWQDASISVHTNTH